MDVAFYPKESLRCHIHVFETTPGPFLSPDARGDPATQVDVGRAVVGGDRNPGRGVQHAVGGQDLLSVGPDAQRGPRDAGAGGPFIQAGSPVRGSEHDMDANS